MKLNELASNKKIVKNKKRIGRGIGSGTGKTSGKGHKGQKSRSGVSIKGFEGGQMPIHRRLPKRGFNNIFRKEYLPINLGIIQKLIDEKKISHEKTINNEVFWQSGMIKKKDSKIKILANGKLRSKINIEGCNFSKTAKNIIEKNGGSITFDLAFNKKEKKGSDDIKKKTINSK